MHKNHPFWQYLISQRHIIHNNLADELQVLAVVVAENDVTIGHIAAVRAEDEFLVLFVVEKLFDRVITVIADDHNIAILNLRQLDFCEYGDDCAVTDDVVHALPVDGHE